MPSTETFDGKVPFKIPRAIQNVGGVRTATISAGETWTAKYSTYQVLNGGAGDRTIVLPAEEKSDGLRYVIRNSGTTNSLIINNDAAATIVTIGIGEYCEVVCDGSAWVKGIAGTAGADDFGATGIKTDVIAESTAAAGVTIDSLQIKDGFVVAGDNEGIKFGDGTDITIAWDATKLAVTQGAPNSAIDLGVDGAGIDLVMYGDTASANLTWDQSADALKVNGVASIQGIRTSSATAAAISGATALTLADSGGVFSVDQGSAYDIDLPSPTSGPGCRYTFYLTNAGANNVTITVLGGAATFVGTIVNDVTSVIPATGSTLTFASGVAALGDNIEITSISTGLYLVRAVTSANGGITIA